MYPAMVPAITSIASAASAMGRSTVGFINIVGPSFFGIMSSIFDTPSLTKMPKKSPMYPNDMVIINDSSITDFNIEYGDAPSAFLIPNSLVRSFTVISIMFPTPTMPAISVPMPIIHIKNDMPANMASDCMASATLSRIQTASLSSGSNVRRCASSVRIFLANASLCSFVVMSPTENDMSVM